MRVLVVEDEVAVAEGIKTWLERGGFRVDLAHTGEDAWFLGDTEEFVAVILDLGLPRMDGLTVLKRWRSDGRNMPVIILTAHGHPNLIDQAVEDGVVYYLLKPITDQLKRTFREP